MKRRTIIFALILILCTTTTALAQAYDALRTGMVWDPTGAYARLDYELIGGEITETEIVDDGTRRTVILRGNCYLDERITLVTTAYPAFDKVFGTYMGYDSDYVDKYVGTYHCFETYGFAEENRDEEILIDEDGVSTSSLMLTVPSYTSSPNQVEIAVSTYACWQAESGGYWGREAQVKIILNKQTAPEGFTGTRDGGRNPVSATATPDERYHQLIYNGSSVNDVSVVWHNAERVLSVSYVDDGDWFALGDMSETQNTVLCKKSAAGIYEVLAGVTSRIVFASDERYENAYGTVALQFFTGDSFYSFEPGIEYAVSFDILANGYHHASAEGDLFYLGLVSTLPTRVSSDTFTDSGIAGTWLTEPYYDGMHTYLDLRVDGVFTLMWVSHNSQYTGTPENWGDGYWVTDSVTHGTYTYTNDEVTMRADNGDGSVAPYRLDGDRLCIVDEYGEEIVFNLIERYRAMSAARDSVHDTYPVVWTNCNADAVYVGNAEYDAGIIIPEDTLITSLSTCHRNRGQSDAPGTIQLYLRDELSTEKTLIGSWSAIGRTGQNAGDVYWDIYPNLVLQAGLYSVEPSDRDSWVWNEGSDGCGFVEVRGHAVGVNPEASPSAGAMPPSPFAQFEATPAPAAAVAPELDDAMTFNGHRYALMVGTWAYQSGSGFAGTVSIVWQEGSSFSGTINIDGSAEESLPDGQLVGDTVSFTRTWSSGMTQTYTGTLSVANGIATVAGTFEGAGGGDSWQMTRAITVPDEQSPLANQLVGAWLSVFDPDGRQGYLEFRADGSFTLSMVSHDPQSEGTPENWGDGMWTINEAANGIYMIRGSELALLANGDDGSTLSIRVEEDRLYTVDEYGDEVVFVSVGVDAGSPSVAIVPAVSEVPVETRAPARGGVSPFATPKPEPVADVLWTNANASAVQNDARDYYVMFDLPDCTVTEIETWHFLSGGKVPGTLILYGADGREYGPFQTEGREGADGAPNAYWVAQATLDLPAGRYAIEDSDPETWSNNGETDGWGMTAVRGISKARTGNPFGGNAASAHTDASVWAGTWDTTYNQMTLQQNGSVVTGSYAYDSGTIEGTVLDNTLSGTWSEHETQVGRFVFTLSPDGNSFTGTFGHGDEYAGGKWDGIRE